MESFLLNLLKIATATDPPQNRLILAANPPAHIPAYFHVLTHLDSVKLRVPHHLHIILLAGHFHNIKVIELAHRTNLHSLQHTRYVGFVLNGQSYTDILNKAK